MVKGKKLLITRPEHDYGTKYLSAWSTKIIKEALAKGVNVIDLHGNKAKQKEFEGRIKKLDPSLIILNGHGDENTVAGFDNEHIIEKGKNAKYINRPLEDKRAGRFLKSSNQVSLSLLKGHSAKEASEKSKELFRKEIGILLTSLHSDPDSLEDAKNLLWDMQHQVCLGAEDKKL